MILDFQLLISQKWVTITMTGQFFFCGQEIIQKTSQSLVLFTSEDVDILGPDL